MLFIQLVVIPSGAQKSPFQLIEDDSQIKLTTDRLEAVIRKKGYVSGIAAGSFLNKRTGFRDAGHGLVKYRGLHSGTRLLMIAKYGHASTNQSEPATSRRHRLPSPQRGRGVGGEADTFLLNQVPQPSSG